MDGYPISVGSVCSFCKGEHKNTVPCFQKECSGCGQIGFERGVVCHVIGCLNYQAPIKICTDRDCNKTEPCGHKRCGFPGAGE